ncbi:MAG: hypothetical protein GYA62_08385 [Bacteroidales bacterium]|nr:hypothetical protein [Bacteroidales bacterium]
MAFDKTEIKQLEKLFKNQEKKIDHKFSLQEKKLDEKLDIRFSLQEKKIDHKFNLQEKNFNEKLDLQFGLQEKKFDEKIDSLAITTKKGFDDVDKRFILLEERMVNLENRFEKHENSNTARFDMISRDIKLLQRKFEQNPGREELFDLEKRVTIVEEKVGIKYDG